MTRALLVTVHFHDGRYHGAGDWPPSPARLFQALVSGTAHGGAIAESDRAALKWLEALLPPVIAAPAHRVGQGVASFVPNNDLDAVGGDPRRVTEIRVAKATRPRLFDVGAPFLYLWRFEEGQREAEVVCAIAERLYQLGRGVDMAFAVGEVLDEADADRRLAACGGAIYRPARTGIGEPVPCPARGSLESLEARFVKMRERFSVAGHGKAAKHLFTQPPKPRFVQAVYECPPARLLFDLRTMDEKAEFAAWPLGGAAALVEHVRNAAERKLGNAMPDKAAAIERVVIGRNSTDADKDQRLRILPLPSIGHRHAPRAIRRMLVEVPSDCPIAAGDINWTFSGLELHDATTGELAGWSLVPAEDRRMLDHYGIEGDAFRVWRTITPAALPERAARRRIDPRRIADELKRAVERAGEEARAATGVLQALRHTRVTTPAESIRVQREPFEARGARAEAFAPGTRFAKERLWHVEIRFAVPRHGPLVIGDGRYLGLGLMAPVKGAWRDVAVFPLPRDANVGVVDAAELIRSVRRALMALSRDDKGRVPRLFSGHEPDGAPASSGAHEHIFMAADDADNDGRIDRLIVVAPWLCDRSGRAPSTSDRALFDRVVHSLSDVRAGRLGIIALGIAREPEASDSLFGPTRTWVSRTLYRPTRHAGRGKDPAAAVVQNVTTECSRRGLPVPEVKLLELASGPKGGGSAARLRLRFAVAVPGPILLGRDSHVGGGLFAAADHGNGG